MLLSNNRIVIFARKGGDFMNLIENNSQKIIALCKKHKVGKLFVFGSILTDRFNDDSDVDMVVDFDKVTLEDYADNYFDLKFSLEDIFGREVDLLEDKAIRNPVLRRNIDNSKVLIYGVANGKTLNALEELKTSNVTKCQSFEDYLVSIN